MFEFMTKILSDGNFVKIYLTSGESFILNELDGEAEGVFLDHAMLQGVRYVMQLRLPKLQLSVNTGKKKKDTANAVSFTI